MGVANVCEVMSEQEQCPGQRSVLTKYQRQAMMLELRLGLVAELNGGKLKDAWRPKAVCTHCKRELTTAEILEGASRRLQNLTVKCPNGECGNRVVAKLVSANSGSSGAIFYCADQVKAAIHVFRHLTEKEIRQRNLGLFQSALGHFGSLTNAFDQVGISYPIPEIPNRQDRATLFLGHAPDIMIAEIIGVAAGTVGKWRKELGREPYQLENYLEE